jgi:hypothetical protein
MTEEVCSRCGKPDSGKKNQYKPQPDKSFICSMCVQKELIQKDE